MFDLFRSRDKAMRYVLGGVLGLVALSMVITLIPGFGSTGRPAEQVVADVGGEPITAREVQVLISQMTKNRQFPPEMIQIYIPQLVDQMVAERALAYQAERMGFKVSDEELGEAIRSMTSQLFPDGQFKSDVYTRFINEQGYQVPEFEANIRKNLLLLKLRNLTLEGVVVTPAEVDAEYHRRNDQIRIDYVAFDPAKVRNSVSVTPAELQDFYNKNKASFKTNEKRTFDVLFADEAKIAASIEMPDAELRKYYDSNRDQFRTPERVKVRHILVSTMNKSKDEASKAEQKANDLLKQIKSGADFAELAKKNSDDPGSAVKGGDLDWVVRGQTVKPFEDTAFSLPAKQTSNVVKTEYGYHILQVTEKEVARLKPFEEVKDLIANERKRQFVYDRMQSSIEQARAALTKNPTGAAAIAQQFGLTHVHADKQDPRESVPELGTSQQVIAAVAPLQKNQVSEVFQIGENKLAVAAVTDVVPPQPASYAEVESQIRKQLTDQRANEAVNKATQEATQKMLTANGDLARIAKELGLEVKSTKPFGAEQTIEGLGPSTYIQDAFAKPVGGSVGPTTIDGKVVLAKVVEKIVADPAKLAASRDDIIGNLKKKKAQERRELFEDGLIAQLVKQKKVKKFPEAIQRLSSTYKS
jgi:peptidyl-prolyl cis-trans isomerase D